MARFGAHVSAAGGVHKSVENALAIGADCMQIFGSSPRQWKTSFPTEENVEKYRKAREKAGIVPVFLHANYLVNLGSPNEEGYEKSVRSLTEHLQIAERLGADGLIFHTGTGKEMDREETISQIVKGISEVLEGVPGKSLLLMENSASAKKIGARPAELGELLARADSPRVGVCIDTAHAFEAGVMKTGTAEGVAAFADELDWEIGMDRIAVFHANDSKTEFGSEHDRHENIGEGYIGREGFANLIEEARFAAKPWILEVPGFAGEGPDKKNLEILRFLT